MISLATAFVIALALSGAPAAKPVAAPPRDARVGVAPLDVPYVPQTDALCGGAALAMVLRYWGDAHANVQEFAPLVDPQTHGIATDALVAAVVQRQWIALQTNAPADVREHLGQRHPVIALIKDGRQYHYVVIVGAGGLEFVVHDPAWGPSRKIASGEFERRWAASGFWSLVVLPNARAPMAPGVSPATHSREADGVTPKRDP